MNFDGKLSWRSNSIPFFLIKPFKEEKKMKILSTYWLRLLGYPALLLDSFSRALLDNISCFMSSADFFQHYFLKILFSGITLDMRVSNSLDSDRARHSVRPDLGSNCSQRL